MSVILKNLLLTMVVLLVQACSDSDNSLLSQEDEAQRFRTITIEFIEKNNRGSNSLQLPKYFSVPLRAIAIDLDGNKVDVTSQVRWNVNDDNVATIDSAGFATGIASGHVDIVANLSQMTSNTLGIDVMDESVDSIQVTPAQVILPANVTSQLRATATLSNHTTYDVTNFVVWTIEDTSIASLSTGGVLTSINHGETNVLASFGHLTSQDVSVTVSDASVTSLQIPQAHVTIASGTNLKMQAIAQFDDGTSVDVSRLATWISADTDVASVDEFANVLGIDIGRTTVHANLNGITSNVVSIDVTEAILSAIELLPNQVKIAHKFNKNLIAQAVYSNGTTKDISSLVAWHVDDINVASINSQGRIFANNIGKTNYSASLGNVTSVIGEVEVTDAILSEIKIKPETGTLPIGLGQALSATGYLSDSTSYDLTEAVAWNLLSAETNIANIDENSVLTGSNLGHVTVTAKLDNITSNEAKFEITPEVLTSVTIISESALVPQGQTANLRAEAEFNNGRRLDVTSTANWQTSDASIATIDTSGLLTAVKQGFVTITVTKDGKSNSVEMEIGKPIELTHIKIESELGYLVVNIDDYIEVGAVGVYDDGSERLLPLAGLTWGVHGIYDNSFDSIIQLEPISSHYYAVFGINIGRAKLSVSYGDLDAEIDVEVVNP